MRRTTTSNDRIHIVHVVDSFEIGGAENGIVNLINNMDTTRFDFSVCTFGSTAGGSAARVRRDGVRYHVLNKGRGNDLGMVMRLARCLPRGHRTIVHTHNWGTYVEGLLAARLRGIPNLVHGEHGTLFLDHRRRLLAYRVASRLTKGFLSVSTELGDVLREQVGVPAEKVLTIPNGVDTMRFRPSESDRARIRRQLGCRANEVLIGTVGRMVPVKNYDVLLASLPLLFDERPEARAVFVGDGPSRSDLERQAADLGVADRVEFVGHQMDIPAWLNACDVFALPSAHEGMANTILEAMATGLPVVATRVGGNPELVLEGETGLLVATEGVDLVAELRTAVRTLLAGDDLRSRLGERGRCVAMEKFALSRMVNDYERAYEDLLEKGRWQPS